MSSQIIAMAGVGLGLKSEAGNKIQVSHVGGRNMINWAITVAFQSLHWLQSRAIARSQIQELNLGTFGMVCREGTLVGNPNC